MRVLARRMLDFYYACQPGSPCAGRSGTEGQSESVGERETAEMERHAGAEAGVLGNMFQSLEVEDGDRRDGSGQENSAEEETTDHGEDQQVGGIRRVDVEFKDDTEDSRGESWWSGEGMPAAQQAFLELPPLSGPHLQVALRKFQAGRKRGRGRASRRQGIQSSVFCVRACCVLCVYVDMCRFCTYVEAKNTTVLKSTARAGGQEASTVHPPRVSRTRRRLAAASAGLGDKGKQEWSRS